MRGGGEDRRCNGPFKSREIVWVYSYWCSSAPPILENVNFELDAKLSVCRQQSRF